MVCTLSRACTCQSKALHLLQPLFLLCQISPFLDGLQYHRNDAVLLRWPYWTMYHPVSFPGTILRVLDRERGVHASALCMGPLHPGSNSHLGVLASMRSGGGRTHRRLQPDVLRPVSRRV